MPEENNFCVPGLIPVFEASASKHRPLGTFCYFNKAKCRLTWTLDIPCWLLDIQSCCLINVGLPPSLRCYGGHRKAQPTSPLQFHPVAQSSACNLDQGTGYLVATMLQIKLQVVERMIGTMACIVGFDSPSRRRLPRLSFRVVPQPRPRKVCRILTCPVESGTVHWRTYRFSF